MHSFDDKINNENMTKCLQTLKENYCDLEKKQVFCPNEAEMRCYMVLMNLNQGDILRWADMLQIFLLLTRYKYRGSVSDMAFLFALASGLIHELDQ